MALEVSTEHIEIVQGAGGPKARIRGSRIRVIDIAIWHEDHDRSIDDIVKSFPQLTKADVFAALAYYWDHRDELEAKEAAGEALASEHPSPLQEKLAQRSLG